MNRDNSEKQARQ